MFPKIKVKPSFNEGLPLTPKVFRIFLTDLLLKTKVPRRFLKMTIIARSKLVIPGCECPDISFLVVSETPHSGPELAF